MDTDQIKCVEIDEAGRLLVFPATQAFSMIYREGVEVHWDESRRALYGPKPRERSYGWWFRHIVNTAQSLRLVEQTEWRNIPPALKAELLEAVGYRAQK